MHMPQMQLPQMQLPQMQLPQMQLPQMPIKNLRAFPALLLSLVSLTATVSAQAASYTFINQLPLYSNPTTPMLKAVTLPKVGTKLRLQVPLSWRQRNQTGADSVLATGVLTVPTSSPVGSLSRGGVGVVGT
jgi:hypothetical protein